MAYNWRRGGSGALSGAAAGSTFGPIGTAVGAGLGAFGGFGNSPGDEAMGYYNRIPGTIKPYYDPYVNAGKWAMPQLQEQFGQMMSDPNAIISRLGQGYQESPGYKWQLGQGEEAINNASAAGGMAGSPQHQQQAGQLATNLANQDFQNYMNQNLGLLGMGTQGAMGLGQLGYGASSELANNLAQTLMSEGNMAYAQGHNDDQGFGGAMGNFAGMFGRGGRSNNWWNR